MADKASPTATEIINTLQLLGRWKLPADRARALAAQLPGTLAQVNSVRGAPVHEVEPLPIFKAGEVRGDG